MPSFRFFYKEQQHRMEVLSQEVVTFGDMYCQMHDLVRLLWKLLLQSRRACVCLRLMLAKLGEAGSFQHHHSLRHKTLWTGWHIPECMVGATAYTRHLARFPT